MELDFSIIWYLALKNMMSFARQLNTLSVKKVVLHMLFLIIMQELKLIHMILCLYKKHFFSKKNFYKKMSLRSIKTSKNVKKISSLKCRSCNF